MKDTERIIEAYTTELPANYDEISYSTPLNWYTMSDAKRYVEASMDGNLWSLPFQIHEIAQFAVRIAPISMNDNSSHDSMNNMNNNYHLGMVLTTTAILTITVILVIIIIMVILIAV